MLVLRSTRSWTIHLREWQVSRLQVACEAVLDKLPAKRSVSEQGSSVVEFVLLIVPMMFCLQGVMFIGFESAGRIEMLRSVVSQSRMIASADFSDYSDAPSVTSVQRDLRFTKVTSVTYSRTTEVSSFCAEYRSIWQPTHLCWQSFSEPQS